MTDFLSALRLPFHALAAYWPLWLLLGACVGSFLSMLAYRLPKILDAQERGEESLLSLNQPPSSCAHCGTPIRWYHNIPFVGFLLVRKATPCCSKPLPWRYLGFETAATLWAAWAWYQYHGSPLQVWGWSAFGWCLLAAAVIDAQSEWLPDVLTLFLLWVGLAYGAMGGPELMLEHRVFAAVGTYLALRALGEVFYALRGVEGLGGGDGKLLAALAVWLPPVLVAYTLLLGSLLQIIWMLSTRKQRAPFGPALCLAGACCYVVARGAGVGGL